MTQRKGNMTQTQNTDTDKAKAEAEARISAMTPEAMLAELVTATTAAAEAKGTKADAPEARMAKAARLLLTTPDVFGAPIPAGVNKWLESASTLSADAFDRLEGDLLSSILSSLAGVPESFRPKGFDKVADKVAEAVENWNATRPGRRSGGTGESTTPESQKLSTFGIGSIRLTMSGPNLAEPKVVEHGSTWSSLSAEINKVAKVVDGRESAAPGEYSYQKVDPKAGPAWRAYVDAVKADPKATATLSIKLAKGTLTVKAEGIPA